MSFTQLPNELAITPRPELKTKHPVTVVVQYGGTTTRPTDIEGALYGWVTTRDGAMVANEPEAAATWYPVDDHPLDKATYDFHVTVPQGLVAVANGNLVSQKTAQGWTTWNWNAPDQMASYLATASVGNFELRTYTASNGVPIIDAVDRTLPVSVSAGLARQGEMIVYFESLFGPYPFTSYGGIVDNDSVGYALETQTRPIYSRRASENTVAHELAHQWLGDAVSPARWQDIWLNEGWATYAQWLWTEHRGGATTQSQFDSVMGQSAANPFWELKIADPGAMHLFADPVYDRGAATLHALRLKVGDPAFFTIAKQWVSRYNDSTATTGDFEELSAEVSGKDLTSFFDVWLHTTGKPTSW